MVVSLVMEANKKQFTTTELPSYKEMLCDEATEDWYAQRDLDEVESEERNCMRLVHQFCLAIKSTGDGSLSMYSLNQQGV